MRLLALLCRLKTDCSVYIGFWLRASSKGADIVCFPEAYLPGLRGQDFEVPHYDAAIQERVMQYVSASAKRHRIAVIMGVEHVVEAGRQIASYVFEANGHLQGYQIKNQLDPSEDAFYIHGEGRRMFEVAGVKFGIVICHEGWRYPETVRWAATRGAKIVFHPQHSGSDRSGRAAVRVGALRPLRITKRP